MTGLLIMDCGITGGAMSANSFEHYDVLLMINQDTGVLYPCSSHAFHFAQGTIRSVVHRSHREVFLDSQGVLSGIVGIRPVDDDYAARVKRVLGFPYEVDVDLEPQAIKLTDLKGLLLTGLQDYRSKLDGDESWKLVLQPYSEIEASVLAAGNPEALYTTLALPGAADCLDLL